MISKNIIAIKHYLLIHIFLVIISSCKTTTKSSISNLSQEDTCILKKIKFDISSLDKRGLTGPMDNKVGLDYEFCIPNQIKMINEVMNIDHNLKKQKSQGRSACSKDKILMIGTTFNKDYKTILCKLSQLEYVKEINQTNWE